MSAIARRRRARVRTSNSDGFDGVPYVIRLSEPITASERLPLAAVRLLRKPIAIVPHPCKTIDEWMERYGSLALAGSVADTR